MLGRCPRCRPRPGKPGADEFQLQCLIHIPTAPLESFLVDFSSSFRWSCAVPENRTQQSGLEQGACGIAHRSTTGAEGETPTCAGRIIPAVRWQTEAVAGQVIVSGDSPALDLTRPADGWANFGLDSH
jgi:hypothetical protein